MVGPSGDKHDPHHRPLHRHRFQHPRHPPWLQPRRPPGRAGAAHPHLGHLRLPGRGLWRALLCWRGTGYFYTRIANPTLALLEGRLAALEEGAGAVVFGSGMGAITATLWSMLEPGDEILTDLTLYGCTFSF